MQPELTEAQKECIGYLMSPFAKTTAACAKARCTQLLGHPQVRSVGLAH
jgi:hypothetical protein